MSEHTQLHQNEIAIDDALARDLIDGQFPEWRQLPIRRIRSSGTVNAIFRVGDAHAIRLPRAEAFVDSREALAAGQAWLDWARPNLPLVIPEPVAIGEPTEAYPWPWSVHRWIEGDSLGVVDLSGSHEPAEQLGAFVNALHSLPLPGPDAPRSVKAIGRAGMDGRFRGVIKGLADLLDESALLAAWTETMEAPTWDGRYVWTHGDLLPDNLLATGGKLTAAIDFECYGSGDPALDLTPEWTVFSGSAADVFRGVVAADDATWQRARNHALRFVNGIRYYETSNPSFAAMCHRTVERALAWSG